MEQVQMMFKIFKWLIAIIFVLIGLNIFQVWLSYSAPQSINSTMEMQDLNNSSHNTQKIKAE